MREYLRTIGAIGEITVREMLRSKTLSIVFGFGVALILVMSLFGAVTIGDQAKVVKDFGLFVVSFFPVSYIVISGSTLLAQEIARKTVYNILSKPVCRGEFVVGKFLGMCASSSVLLIGLALALSGYLAFFEGAPTWALWQAFLLCWSELVIMCGVVIFFSSMVVTPVLAGGLSFGVFLAGRSTGYLLYFIQEGISDGIGAKVFTALYWTIPHFNSMTVVTSVVHGDVMQGSSLVWGTLYSTGYTVILLLCAQFFFRKRDFN